MFVEVRTNYFHIIFSQFNIVLFLIILITKKKSRNKILMTSLKNFGLHSGDGKLCGFF